MRLSSLILLLTLAATPAFAGPFAGAIGGSGSGGGLGAGSTPLVVGELLFVGADGEAASVPGSIVDPGTGYVSLVNVGSVEVTSTDINGMGTFANNNGALAATVNNCSTTNATLSDDSFRIVDIDEGGVSGTIDFDIFEQCLGKTTALDDYKVVFSYPGTTNLQFNLRCASVTGDASDNSIIATSAGAQECFVDLRQDQADSNEYLPVHLSQMTCTILTAPGGWADGTCLTLPIRACDIDGGIASAVNDCVVLDEMAFAYNGSGDCAVSSKDCGGAFPCRGTKYFNTTTAMQGLTVTTGAGQVDALLMMHEPADTNNTADAISSIEAACTLWYKN